MENRDKPESSIFILGAGASQMSGTPLMGDFLDCAELLWRTGQVPEYETEYQMVFEARSKLQAVFAKANIDIQNVEDVFAAFEMGRTLGSLPDYSESQIEQLIESMKRLIVKTIELTQKYRATPEGFVPPVPYADLAGLIKHLQNRAEPSHRVAIITFNYDVGCEYALHKAGIKYTYGLGDFDSSENHLPILKLHGSVNWGIGKRKGREILRPARFDGFEEGCEPDLAPESSLGSMKISNLIPESRWFEDMTDLEPFIVPPTWDKTQYHRQISRVWRRAAQELKSAENIFVSGYSLPSSDAFFKYLYALGTVGSGLIRRFWVFDPDEAVNGRFKTLLGRSVLDRYSFFGLIFRDAISHIRKEFLA